MKKSDKVIATVSDVLDEALALTPLSLSYRHIVLVNPHHSPKVAAVAPDGQEYVDPFLFETGHFESREEYEELSRTAKIKPRARP